LTRPLSVYKNYPGKLILLINFLRGIKQG
jgi:hypothetical protein